MIGRLAGVAALLLGLIAGARVLRRRARRRVRLDVYFEDGAMLSLPGTMPEAEAALAPAREALRAAAST